MTLQALSPEAIARLPTPKGVALALLKACRSDAANLQQIADLVRTDPALSGRLLTLANSAASGGRNIVSIDEAVSRTGLGAVSQIALAFSLIDQHSSGFCANFNYAGFWSQSLLMAAASRELGAAAQLGPPGELFTVGLFAQVGQLALATAYPVEYSELLAQDVSRTELLAREKTIAGLDHLTLSVALMAQWGVPPEYSQPFGFHDLAPATGVDVDPRLEARSRLAHAAWHVAVALVNEGIDAAIEAPACVEATAWLGLDAEQLRIRITEIESVWRLWLALISRNS
jgi:two-component system cell cycle response regulator